MAWKIVWSPSAEADLRGIVRYIAKSNPAAAERVGYKLITAIESLDDFPERGRVIPEFNDEFLREIIVGNYRILYSLRLPDRLLRIVRIWHGARGTPVIYEEK